MVFSLASGNIAGAFEIITTNDSIGEVFVARLLDREELDHYILKVGTSPPPSRGNSAYQHTLAVSLLLTPRAMGQTALLRAKSSSEADLGKGILGGGVSGPRAGNTGGVCLCCKSEERKTAS